MDDVVISEVDPAAAEAVLTVRLFIPGVAEGGEDRHYLARTPRFDRVVESVTRNPDGSVTTISTVTLGGRQSVSHAHGRTADGRGFGRRTSVSVEARSADEAVVRLSMSWTARDGSRGSLDEELVVPWLGAVRVDLAGGRWVAAAITPVGAPAEPGDALGPAT